jgi:outer membrane protein OmpA-like peptidoglycan-associated protein
MVEITIDDSVMHFITDKWAIPKAPDSEEALNDAVTKLNEYPALRVNVYGHTDSTGTVAWNTTLSKRRAESVAKYLSEHGIDAARLDKIEGFAATEPIADNKTKEGRSKNRRVQIVAVEPIKVPAK